MNSGYEMDDHLTSFSRRVIQIIQSIPYGTTLSYGEIAALADHPRAARQVARLLHSCTGKYDLPWHRVIGSNGCIRLSGAAAAEQIRRLSGEGIEIKKGKVVRAAADDHS